FSQVITSATRKAESAVFGSNRFSTSSPLRVNASAIFSTPALVSRCSLSHAYVNFMALGQAGGEGGDGERREAVMPEPAEIAREESAPVGHAVFQHGDAVDAEAEGEALIAVRIKPDILEHVGMHHAAAENLEPIGAFADPKLVAHLGVADVDLHRRLGEGEVARAESHLHMRHLEERLAELLEHPFQVAEMGLLIDGEPFDLMEHRRVRLV